MHRNLIEGRFTVETPYRAADILYWSIHSDHQPVRRQIWNTIRPIFMSVFLEKENRRSGRQTGFRRKYLLRSSQHPTLYLTRCKGRGRQQALVAPNPSTTTKKGRTKMPLCIAHTAQFYASFSRKNKTICPNKETVFNRIVWFGGRFISRFVIWRYSSICLVASGKYWDMHSTGQWALDEPNASYRNGPAQRSYIVLQQQALRV